MILSIVMIVSEKGVLLYIGHKGELYEIVGGKDGVINLVKVENK